MKQRPSQADIAKSLSLAISAHQSGQRLKALQLYQSILADDPQNAYVQYLHGAVLYETGQNQAALEALQKSVALKSPDLAVRSILGAVHAALGQHDLAIDQFRVIAKEAPHVPEAHNNLANAYLTAQRYVDSAAFFRKALSLKQAYPEAMRGLGIALDGGGDKRGAAQVFRECISKFPNYSPTYISIAQTYLSLGDDVLAEEALNLCLSRFPNTAEALLLFGILRYRQIRLEEAQVLFQKVVRLAPGDALPYAYLAGVLLAHGKTTEAELNARKAYSINPRDAEVLTNLGLIVQARGATEEAITYQRQAVEINPGIPETWNNLGLSLQHLGNLDEAIECYDKAISLKAQFHGALANKAQALLSLGRLAEGWKIYGSRFDQKLMASSRRAFPYPMWAGQSGADIRLLLWTDQGLGDEVLYASMITEAMARVGVCILECSSRMVPLFQRSFPKAIIVPRSTPTNQAIASAQPTHQISLIELGSIFRQTLESIPAHKGYLKPDENLASTLRQKYQTMANGRRIVGVSWKSENFVVGSFKSVALETWIPILKVPNIFFVCVQYGVVKDDLAKLKETLGIDIFHDTEIDPLVSPDQSAAQIAAMDLVISTSNTTVHFAGALSVPVWTMAPIGPGALWYWFADRDTSPWYPTMRIFRQLRPGEWSDVVANVAMSLQKWLRS